MPILPTVSVFGTPYDLCNLGGAPNPAILGIGNIAFGHQQFSGAGDSDHSLRPLAVCLVCSELTDILAIL